MKIKNLIIPILCVLVASIAQPALSTQPYYCVYNWSGHRITLYTSKELVYSSLNHYWACSGSIIGPTFPTSYSVRVTAGLPVYLCLSPSYLQGGAVAVGNLSTDPINGSPGTTFIITSDPNNPSNFVQVARVCSDPKNFQVCMATGHAAFQSFNVDQCPCGPAGCG